MKKIIFLIFINILVFSKIIGQGNVGYKELVDEASKLYQDKEYSKSGQRYSDAFRSLGDKGIVNDRYNAACAWALANESDSSFIQLFKIAQNANYSDLQHLTTDSDLRSLHDDTRWASIVELVKSNKAKTEANWDRALISNLDTIFEEDQTYRIQAKEVEENYGWESIEMKSHWKLINEKDSINLIKVQNILDTRGWLGEDIIGSRGNQTLFLVIQHADLDTQEKYLPMMRDAVRKGNAKSNHLALLEDRVALRKGGRQIYGSQIGRDKETGEYYVLPLIDPDNVDKRRAEVGLGTIQDYIQNWGMTWDVEEYKKKLLEYESKQK
ncbi:hypothetical protein E2605_06665 [Dysgonomonas capnocytophagoides]|uniref:Uncharacterized protein n=1 Tax=Dysgonomonas capnocytophagoides TaxID=45254 RepID=A0A4Y8L3V5_9BACT|nr:DUF6624 domain-containing protein [Dysgonomonas capnocytophagoides]TFD97345.1 hypothetical protein E2605_06665 [Dysgonomonas capnocytophagoides]